MIERASFFLFWAIIVHFPNGWQWMSSRIALDLRNSGTEMMNSPSHLQHLRKSVTQRLTLSSLYNLICVFFSLVNASLPVVFTKASLCVLIDTDNLMLCYGVWWETVTAQCLNRKGLRNRLALREKRNEHTNKAVRKLCGILRKFLRFYSH